MRRAALLLLLALASGCASALHDRPGVPVTGASDTAANRTAAELLAEARAAWAHRPDLAEVRRARRLFLAAARREPGAVDGLLGAADATAFLVEHVTDPGQRERLAGEGVDLGQLCLERAPGDPRCRYRLALALGQQARERPSTGLDGVRRMVDLLRGLVRDAPGLDDAGPERVLALVLLRAPGWPTGPGDPEEGLEQARRAVELAPEDPRNLTVLAEALLANGEPRAACAELATARRLLGSRRAAADPDAAGQLHEIERLEARCAAVR